MIRSLVLCAPILSFLFQGSPTAYLDVYHQGLEQLRAGNEKGAIELLNQAIKANPKPSASPRYTPYFYLALSYDSNGDERDALTYYEKSASLKELESFPDDKETLETNLEELRDSGRTFEVVVKKPANAPEKPVQKAPESKPKGNEIAAASRPPSGEPAAVKPVPKPATEPPKALAKEQPKDQAVGILREAVLKYLSGDYSSALQAAQQYLDQGGKQVDKASFVAGASLFSQFLLTGQKDEGLQQAADRYLKGAGSYSPPRAWISPVVLEHYQQLARK